MRSLGGLFLRGPPIRPNNAASSSRGAIDDYDAHIANIGVGWASLDQPAQGLEKVIRVIAAEVIGCIEAQFSGFGQELTVHDGARGVGWAVLAVGAGGE